MTADFDPDRAALLAEMEQARAGLLDVVDSLTPGDLARARRGSWAVSRVLDHVVQSERIYTQLISVFSGVGAETAAPAGAAEAAAAATTQMAATRDALLAALSHVQEEDFYRLQAIGHEEYSVLSIIENVISHDHEHAEQIRKTLAEA